MVSASSATVEPSIAITVRSFTMRTARWTTTAASWITEPGLRREASEPSAS
jgi:hypothetical protein